MLSEDTNERDTAVMHTPSVLATLQPGELVDPVLSVVVLSKEFKSFDLVTLIAQPLS